MGKSGFSGPKQKQTKIKDLNFEQSEPKIFQTKLFVIWTVKGLLTRQGASQNEAAFEDKASSQDDATSSKEVKLLDEEVSQDEAA